jgi:hypothetical protein
MRTEHAATILVLVILGNLGMYVATRDPMVLGLGAYLLAAVYYGLMKGRGGRL